jgi:SAM-dependent methyltransferase
MRLRVYREFEKICASKNIRGSVLEIGAMPDETSLLNMDSLKDASEKIGVSLDGPFKYKDFEILKGNANNMDFFSNGKFDVVLCNSVLEHDRYFWKTISEIRRVTKKGGLIVIGTPGYDIFPYEKQIHRIFGHLPFLSRTFLAEFTLTLHVHNFPGDYYRFSRQTFQEVFFEGMKQVDIRVILLPSRIIGSGIKP